jgi:uncharacterized protein
LQNTSLRKFVRWVIFAIPATYVLLCSALYFRQEGLLFRPEKLEANFRFEFPQKFTEINLPVDGATLNALHFTEQNPKGAVLYFHGNSGSLKRWGEVAESFMSRNFDLFIVDYRGYGKSSGTIRSEQQLIGDGEIAYEYVSQRYAPQNIVIYGRSLGTGLAAQIAQRHPSKLLILETPYVSLKELTGRFYPYVPGFLLKFPMRTDLALPKIKSPVYLIHGTADEVVPYDSSEKLLPLIQTRKELVTIPDGPHNGLRTTPLYNAALDRILR